MFRRLVRLSSQIAVRPQQSQHQRSHNLRYLGIAAAVGVAAVASSDESMGLKSLMAQWPAECSNFSDRQINGCLEQVHRGIDEIKKQTPGYEPPKVSSGLRGTRYFIEFPIVGKSIDAFQIIVTVESLLKQGKSLFGSKITATDSYMKDDSVSYMIDFENNSTTAMGGRSKGSIYLRGVRGQNGTDSFKFVFEKSVDFCDLDAQVIVETLQMVNRMCPPAKPEQPTKRRFSAKNDSKQNQAGDGMINQSGQDEGKNNDPVSALEGHGCSVFLPDAVQNKLDWDYLAGYETVKRSIEDTVLLALTNADVYDKITAVTRMKNETNRPKCVLFEGPPGCGKTTSARIISHQVQIPLVYMPLEAIMSKFYGESESRLAEIFEAAQALGSVILFIDEIDSLATSREQGLHEATRRILSTLLRKIDSFESEGEVLVICATNRKKDLDPALISRTDLSIRFELPDAKTRSSIFQRYARQLTKEELEKLGEMAVNLSGRDISDICKDAERRWASKYIRKEVTKIAPDFSVYEEATKTRLVQMNDANLRMEADTPHQTYRQLQMAPMAFGGN